MKHYDYSRFGYYYVTICTENRLCIFGNVFNGKMVLNDVGEIVDNVWLTIPKHFDNAKSDTLKQINNIVGVGSSDPHGKFNKIFQRNYYEHVVRNENELIKIREYIKTNPLFWDQDIYARFTDKKT